MKHDLKKATLIPRSGSQKTGMRQIWRVIFHGGVTFFARR